MRPLPQLPAGSSWRHFPGKWRAPAVRMFGAVVKSISYPFHAVFPKRRYSIPDRSPAKADPEGAALEIPRIVWQTNFTEKCSLPMWVNYRFNRMLSRDFTHCYVSTEARELYMREHASPRVYTAFSRLTDGAAQADVWRIQTLYDQGGVYMDIDATLLRPLSTLLAGQRQFFIWDNRDFSNFFIATVPKNPLFQQFLDVVVSNIENYSPESGKSVFYVTGPGALYTIMPNHPVVYTHRRESCIQGAITNEHFQYIDRPRSKWKYKKTFVQAATPD